MCMSQLIITRVCCTSNGSYLLCEKAYPRAIKRVGPCPVVGQGNRYVMGQPDLGPVEPKRGSLQLAFNVNQLSLLYT